MEYLMQSGIEKIRLKYKGYGETQILTIVHVNARSSLPQ
jgi:hypothetical protein